MLVSLIVGRIHKYAACSNECFILALIYIDRLIQRNNFLLTELNVHRVVICAVLLAAKFFDDAYYNNAFYAKVGGVLVSEINGLEVDFLFRINFSLHVTSEEFEKYRVELLQQALSPAPAQVSPEVHSAPAPMEAEPMGIAPGPSPIVQPSMHIQSTMEGVVENRPMMATGGYFPNDHVGMPYNNGYTTQYANTMPPLMKHASPSFPLKAGGMIPVQPQLYQADMLHFMEQQYGVIIHHHHGPVVIPSNVTCAPSSPNEGVGRRVAGMSGVGL